MNREPGTLEIFTAGRYEVMNREHGTLELFHWR